MNVFGAAVAAIVGICPCTAIANQVIESPVLAPSHLLSEGLKECLESRANDALAGIAGDVNLVVGPLHSHVLDADRHNLAGYVLSARNLEGRHLSLFLEFETGEEDKWRRVIDQFDDHFFVAESMKPVATVRRSDGQGVPVHADVAVCAPHF